MIKIIENVEDFLSKLAVRGNTSSGEFYDKVNKVVNDVKINKDEALFKYINKYESKEINKDNFIVKRNELKKYYDGLDKNLKETLDLSAKRISEFHTRQLRQSWMETKPNGEILGQLVIPIENVGIYVPGGKASYPSSVLMNALPAKVAGVKKIIMATPSTNANPIVYAAAYLAGIEEIYLMGGAQAIAALAYGTPSVPKVDKIVGPGNIYVALAKREVFGSVSIDSIAGPSEILVIADDKANPRFIAADLLSQAEHDEQASSVLLTNSLDFAKKVSDAVNELGSTLSRKAIFEKSLNDFSGIIVTSTIDEAIDLANRIAPEHMEIVLDDAFSYLPKVKNAGAIFLGSYSPEPLGDYMAGPNHVLPTCGSARFFSPLNVDDFCKKSSIISFSKEAFMELKDNVATFAEAEGFTAHALSATIRGENK